MMPRQQSRKCSMIVNWLQNLMRRDSSFHLQTLSISEDWFRRSYITYTHIQDLLEMEQLKPVKRSM